MSTRTITHTHTGPGVLRLELAAGQIRVTAAAAHTRATVRLTAQPGDTAAAAAIEAATVSQAGDALAVAVPAAGGRDMQFGTVHGDVHGGIVVTGGTVIVGGTTVISTGGGTVIVGGTGGGVLAEVTVPTGHRVTLDTRTGSIHTSGHLAAITAETGSGSVEIEHAGRARVRTGSGGIHIGHATDLQAHTGSGSVRVRDAAGLAELRTGSGDIHVHLTAPTDLTARTGSGDITATAAAGVSLQHAQLRTGSGRVTTRTP